MKLSNFSKLSFGIGALGKDLCYAIISYFLMIYFTDTIGLTPLFVGNLFLVVILSRLVDTFFSRISPTMQLPPKHHSIAYVLPWAEGLHWQSRSSGCSNS